MESLQGRWRMREHCIRSLQWPSSENLLALPCLWPPSSNPGGSSSKEWKKEAVKHPSGDDSLAAADLSWWKGRNVTFKSSLECWLLDEECIITKARLFSGTANDCRDFYFVKVTRKVMPCLSLYPGSKEEKLTPLNKQQKWSTAQEPCSFTRTAMVNAYMKAFIRVSWSHSCQYTNSRIKDSWGSTLRTVVSLTDPSKNSNNITRNK